MSAHRERPSFSSIFVSLRCFYSWLRMVWLIGISKPADYHISSPYLLGGFMQMDASLVNVIFLDVVNRSSLWAATVWQRFFFLLKENKQRIERKSREEAEHCRKYFHCQFVLNRPLMCSLWSFSRLFRNRPRVCKGAGWDEHNWYCGSHTLWLLKFHNR